MLALKKKREAEKKAAEAAAAAAAADTTDGGGAASDSGSGTTGAGGAATPPTTTDGAGGSGGEKVSLFGIGGAKKTKKGDQAGTKKTPGEIRIQKGTYRMPPHPPTKNLDGWYRQSFLHQWQHEGPAEQCEDASIPLFSLENHTFPNFD